jgi:cobalt-zinc-cadmium efflux system membrane fusion protein
MRIPAKDVTMSIVKKNHDMTRQRTRRMRLIVLGAIILSLIMVGVAAGPHIRNLFQNNRPEPNTAGANAETVQSFYDYRGETSGVTVAALLGSEPLSGNWLTATAWIHGEDYASHFGLVLTPATERALMVRAQPARRVSAQKPLPSQLGQVAYDIDRLYPVRSIANGKVIEIEERFDPSLPGPHKYRPYGFGDHVEKGTLLAVVRSPDLAEKKGAYVDALLDLRVDQEKLQALEGPYQRGAIPEGTYRDALAKVQKDELTVGRTKRILELVPLPRSVIEDLEHEAESIRKLVNRLAVRETPATQKSEDSKEYRARVERWARVEVKADADGMIIEKNTNLGDIADPGKDPPLFRIADLRTLSVWIHPPEEYLPVLQKLLQERPTGEVTMEMRVQSDPQAPTLKGKLLRFGPSIDPFMRTPLLLGRVENPDRRLLIGQLLQVTIYVPQEAGLVEIPMKAVNEVGGESLVFVQAREFFHGMPRYTLRRVSVVHRFQNTAQVRSRLTAGDLDQIRKEKKAGKSLRPVEPLRAGEWVATGGVVEMTEALEGLQAEAGAPDKEANR